MTTTPKNRPTQHDDEPIYLVGLRAFIYAMAAFVNLYGLALGSGLVGGMLGAAASVWIAHLMCTQKIRGAVIAATCAGAIVAGLVFDHILTGTALIASGLGIANTLALTDFLVFGTVLLGVGVALRTIATRFPTMALIEVAFITLGVVRLLAGHRDQAISEPRFLSDWVWSQGGDPIVALMAIGALVMGTVPLLLLVKQRATKAALSIATLALLGLFAFGLMRIAPPEPPPPNDPMGLTGKKNEEEEAKKFNGQGIPGDNQGQPGQARGQKGDDPSEMPFRDDYPQGEPKPVAVVRLHDDYTSPDGYYYFRQTAFSHFNGYRLVRSFLPDSDPDLLERFPAGEEEVSDLDREYRSFEELTTTVALITDHKQPFGLANALTFRALKNPNPDYFRRAYEVTSLAPRKDFKALLTYTTAGDPDWPEALRNQYTRSPDDPRYKELADEIVGELPERHQGNPVAKALALRRWLEKNTVYTRKSSHAGQQDPTASFLFGSRRGYCVHLAHSMAFMMRSQGLPTRVAAGYLVDEARRASGSTVLIQNQDAHAWAEIYLDGLGWVVMDVAPEQAEDGGGAPINPDLQRTLGELLRGEEDAGKEVGKDRRIRWGRLLAVFGLPFVLLLMGLLYGVKLWRRVAWRFLSDAQLYRLAYRASLDALADVGVVRRYGETREGFARRVAVHLPALTTMTHAHMRRALGGDDPLTREQWLRHHNELNTQLGAHHEWWKRALGLLNPFSWMRVR